MSAREFPTPIRLALGERLQGLLDPGQSRFFLRLEAICRHFARHTGVRLPRLAVELEPELEACHYQIEIHGQIQGHGEVEWGKLLAVGDDEALGPLIGAAGIEPVYGMPGKWIVVNQAAGAAELGCMLFDPEALLATHLIEVLQRQLYRLLDLEQVCERLEQLGETQPAVVAELRSRVSLRRLVQVMQSLCRERVSLRNFPALAQALALRGSRNRSVEWLTEVARAALAPDICAEYLNENGELAGIVMSEGAEELLRRELKRGRGELDVGVGARWLEAFGREYEAALTTSSRAVLVVAGEFRPVLAGLVARVFPDLGVLSWAEIPPETTMETLAVLGSRFHPTARKLPSEHYVVHS